MRLQALVCRVYIAKSWRVQKDCVPGGFGAQRLWKWSRVSTLALQITTGLSKKSLGFWSKTVTRFKELRRIEHAIEHKNEVELRWALDYCTMRRKLAAKVYTIRKQEKYWRQLEGKVRSSLEDPN